MASLLYTKFDCDGERLGLVDYIDRILGTPHPPRVTKKEEELAVQNAIERPVVAIYQNTHGTGPDHFADCIRNEVAQVVDIVHQYTWLNEDDIWKLAYEILRRKTITEVE
jgi:hypothetical protein